MRWTLGATVQRNDCATQRLYGTRNLRFYPAESVAPDVLVLVKQGISHWKASRVLAGRDSSLRCETCSGDHFSSYKDMATKKRSVCMRRRRRRERKRHPSGQASLKVGQNPSGGLNLAVH